MYKSLKIGIEKEINFSFSFSRNAILDLKIRFCNEKVYNGFINLFWLKVSYYDYDNMPF
ncbi:hypothetical protein ACFQ5N_02265 [Lutibacter holmesii]|uniref:Uncharacterized protein n=1 Tax=Lutibacter holmesii TaxID=1137985 RepID=A0ABW3WJP4_9FLAO